MIPKLRPYQEDIIRQVVHAKKDGYLSPCVVSPTGSGKTIMFSFLSHSATKKAKRILILVHRIEILQQTLSALFSFGVQAGAIASGKPMTSDLIQCAMIQTISHRMDQIVKPDMIIIDECHHSTSNTYMKIIKKYHDVFRVGFTATPERYSGEGLIEAGYDIMIEGPTTRWLVENGFLSRPRVFLGPDVRIEKKKAFKMTRGDYDKEEQLKARKKRSYIGNVIQHYKQHLDGLPVVCFCVSVEHCEIMEKEFSSYGYRAATVHGGMRKEARDAAISGLGTGEVQVVCSCDVISEGVDVPVLAGVILLRQTKSLGLYLQQVGRALRLYPGKEFAIILDHAGCAHEHGLPLADREWSLLSKKRSQRDKITPPEITVCPRCGGSYAGRVNTCPDCGFDIETHRLHEQGKKTPEEIEGVLREVLDENHTEQEIAAIRDQAARIQQMSPADRQRAMLANLRRSGKSDRVKGLAAAVGYDTNWTEAMWQKFGKK